MQLAANILIGVMAAEHIYFLVLETFLWQKKIGLETFTMTKEFAATTAVLAKNQGVYNGFLAAGLVWSIWATNTDFSFMLKNFFCICVLVAGVIGGMTIQLQIFFVQAVPAIITLGLLWLRFIL